MNLTGQQLIDQGIITNNPSNECIAQHGVDLCVEKIEHVIGTGFIPKEGKTTLADRIAIQTQLVEKPNSEEMVECFLLEPGTYDFTFAQGCKVPVDQRLDVIQRSSLSRNGVFIRSAVFDAGFETNNIGTMVQVNRPIYIEKGARVAQILAIASNVVDKPYEGQWQGDKQRKS
jgi:deoxycytidine triphosphate deaminase